MKTITIGDGNPSVELKENGCIHIFFCAEPTVDRRFDVYGTHGSQTAGVVLGLDVIHFNEPLVDEEFFSRSPLELRQEIQKFDRQIQGGGADISFYYFCDFKLRDIIERVLSSVQSELTRTLVFHYGSDVVAWIQFANSLAPTVDSYATGTHALPEPLRTLPE